MKKVAQLLARGEFDRDKLLALARAREPYYVPEGTPLNPQLLQFQRQRRRVAFIVDEYGDVQGLVTLEDLLEEIVGEFTSDTSALHKDVHRANPATFRRQRVGERAHAESQDGLDAAGDGAAHAERPDRRIPRDDSGARHESADRRILARNPADGRQRREDGATETDHARCGRERREPGGPSARRARARARALPGADRRRRPRCPRAACAAHSPRAPVARRSPASPLRAAAPRQTARAGFRR